MAGGRKPRQSLTEYYSAQQLRIDRWTTLRSTTEQLRRATEPRRRQALHDKAAGLFNVLRPIELYWAYPGHRMFDRLSQLLVEERHADLAKMVASMVRQLLSDGYRRRAQGC